jgi:ribosomal protein L16/L10AE
MRPSFLKRALLGATSLIASAVIAHAAITGTWSEKQDEQIAVGQLQLGMGAATGNSVTINQGAGVVTTASLSTAAGATQAITVANNRIAVGDSVQCTVDPITSTGTPTCANAAVTAGQIVFTIQNIHASVALNAAVRVYFTLNKAGNSN